MGDNQTNVVVHNPSSLSSNKFPIAQLSDEPQWTGLANL
jgi:hypothetical protein